jgi:hypothetical protein
MDYPKGKVSVSASIKWLRATADQSSPALSARIREGEKLFRMGSYDAAVAMLAAGLEEYLQEYVPMQQSISTLGRLSRFLELGTLGPEFQTQLATVMDIRRRAVHGTDRESVDRAEAEKVRRAVRTILKKLPSKIDVIVS